jgi:peptidoglycan/LPS O-acetylase OafA/YrhL
MSIGTEQRITVLDGWRGVSILLVIVGHVLDYRLGAARSSLEFVIGDVISMLGVCVFFVISGFIITKLALREHAARGSLSVRNFYLRRLLRIVPAFYAYLLFVIVLAALNLIIQQHSRTAAAAGFICNLPQVDCGWFAAHSWSLDYEEQFYLLFPLVFVVLGGRIRMIAALLCISLISVPALRYFLHLASPWGQISRATLIFSFICAGMLFASQDDRIRRLWQLRRPVVISWAAALLLLALMLSEVASHMHPEWNRLLRAQMLLRPTFEPLCVAWLVGSSIYNSGRVARILNIFPLQFIGMVSYSLYLWQQLFTGPASAYPHTAPLLLLLPLMFVFACMSYYSIERPCSRLAKRLTQPRGAPVAVPHPGFVKQGP